MSYPKVTLALPLCYQSEISLQLVNSREAYKCVLLALNGFMKKLTQMRPYLISLSVLVAVSCSQPKFDENRIETYNFLSDFNALNDAGLVNAIIEIPAGSNQKWEVEKDTGHLAWEIRGDSLRVIQYLPYPANYGMVPQTWLPEHLGGDNDPLDIFVIGPALERGRVVGVRLIGVIKMLDNDEQDDKLIAINPDSWFDTVHSLNDLHEQFPGISEILVLWLQHYKGEGFVEVVGVGDEIEANNILKQSIEAYIELQKY